MGNSKTTRWDPAFITRKVLTSNNYHLNSPSDSVHQYAAIVVNQPIEDQRRFLDILAGGNYRSFLYRLSSAIVDQMFSYVNCFC